MKKVARYIISFFSAFILSLVGIILGLTRNIGLPVLISLIVLSLIPIALFFINIILTKNYAKKINSASVADINSYMLHHRSEAEQSSCKKLRQLQRIRHTTAVYTVVLWILAAVIAVFAGILYTYKLLFYVISLIYSSLIFYAVYSRIRKAERFVFDESTIYLKESEYPNLYSLARRAADCVGCPYEIAILLSLDCNARILTDKKRYLLQVGIILLNTLSEEEIFQIFLHEFSHVSEKRRDAIRENKYKEWLYDQGKMHSRYLSFVTTLFQFLDIRYSFNFMVCQYATSVVDETEADRAMVKYGNPEIAASALLKTQYDSMYFWESGVKDEAPLYQPETLSADYLSTRIAEFKKAIEERHADWDALVEKEILPNNATHPTLKMRMETLGVSEIKTVKDNSSEEYRKEIKNALDYSEKLVYEERKLTYDKDRAELYLKPLEHINEWKEKGMPVSAESYADIISDLKRLGRNTEAEALCDRAIEELPESSSMHAYFIKGSAMLYRYDVGGLEYIYHAIENNPNYLEEGLDVIGAFCCYTGREKELLEYRENAARLVQKNKDESSQTCFLTKNDKLTKDDMPEGMLEDILSFIRSIDCDIIQNIYLVRKTVSDTFFASVFIIHFYGGTDAQRDEIMHKIFRYLDSYPADRHFSLFDYFDYPEIKVEKIEGSLVYSKSEEQGE